MYTGRRLAVMGGMRTEGCVPVSTLQDGLLLLLARSGQLTALYEEGALC